jgi:predicted RNase H-like HicB family nuclease
MQYRFTGVFEKGEKYYIGYCMEMPEANGQGETLEECKKNLIEAIKLVLEDKKEAVTKYMEDSVIKEEIFV